MRKEGIALGVLLVLAACGLPPDAARPSVEQREAIVGGQPDPGDGEVGALEVSYPDGGGYLCSGVLIGPSTFVTAAHCSLDPQAGAEASVFVGPNLLASPGIAYRVDAALSHPDYDPTATTDQNDIGVIHLASPIPGAVVDPNDLPLDRLPLAGVPVRMVGYGVTGPLAADDGVRRDVTKTDIALAGIGEVSEGAPSGGLTCAGDSGGPLLFALPGGRQVAMAVTSRGDQDCDRLGYATRLDSYLASFLYPFMVAHQDAPSCGPDRRCAIGCSAVDPDCPCAPDGMCGACSNPADDPDCPQSCLFDGGTCVIGSAAPTSTPAAPESNGSSSGCIQAPDGSIPWLALVSAMAWVARRPPPR